ncbi:hypothetical protein HQ585_04520 [candidate division KSB1 bacterium]|nr:hypothetical protein [candidate division KSB1 bacterium]
MATNPYIALILIPIVVGLVNLILPRLLQKILTLIGIGLTGFLTLKLALDPEFFEWIYEIQYLGLDKLGIFALVGMQVLALIILLFALKGVNSDIERSFFILYPLTVGFCNGVILSDHAIVFMVFWGLSGVTLYLFNLLGRGKEASESARKTFMLIGGSDACLILGFVMLGLAMPQASWSITAMQMPLSGSIAIIAFVCLLIAALAKAGGFPFHTWVPSYSKEAPVESVAFLPASLDKILGIYLLARMVMQIFQCAILVHMILISIGAITVIAAVMMALIQHNGRKLLGYHAVSQVGYMIMGVGSGSPIAFAGGLFHMLNHTIYKSNLFLALGSVEKQTGTNELDDLGGLGKKMPITLIMAMVGAFSISGLPPFNGFFSKWMIYQGLLDLAKEVSPGYEIWLLVCFVLAIFGSALTLASFLKYLHAIFLGKLPKKYDKIKEAPINQWLSTGLLSALCVVLGLFAMELPLKMLILPILEENGMAGFEYAGLYKSKFTLVMMGLVFLIGLITYILTRKVRFDAIYLGGMDALEKFRVTGTEFYQEIRRMKPLCTIYDWAEKKWLDLYALLGGCSNSLGGLFQKAHPGLLSLYLLYIVLGMLVFMLLK